MSDEVQPSLPRLSAASQIRWAPASEWVDVPEWGCQVNVQELTVAEKDEMNSFLFEVDGSDYTLNMNNQTNRLVVFSARDEHGNRIWPNTKKGIAHVATLGSAGAERIAEKARELSKLTKESRKRVEGNSQATPSDESSSDTPSPSEDFPAS